MATIRSYVVRMTPAAELPQRWAAELGRMLVPDIEASDCDLLQERTVGLGHGVLLAHLRTHRVSRPILGAWKASDRSDDDEDAPWLWLVVLVPAGDPSRHLGWMAHLAAALHDPEHRERLRRAEQSEELEAALGEALRERAHGIHRAEVPAPATTTAGAVQHRMVIAILKEVEFVDHLLSLFLEYDVRGATVLEARGMAEHLAAHMSLFAGFKSAFKAVGHSQVILTVVPVERTEEVLALVREAAGGMSTPGSGIAFALDVPVVIGLDKRED